MLNFSKTLIFPSISVREHCVVENEQLFYIPMILTCAPVQIEGGWTLSGEDPALFAPPNILKDARREWPDTPYPTIQPGEVVSSDTTPTHKKEELEELLKMHHSFTKLITKMGVDPCKVFKEARVQNILASIDATDLECKVCGKMYSSASRMRLHIQQKHVGVTNYQCPTCKKYYVNEQSLQGHIARGHDVTKTHKCPHCTKSFATANQLTLHQPMHSGPKYECKFTPLGCDRKYVYKRGKVDHEAKCKKNPKAPKPQVECDICPKKFFDNRGVNRHMREVHKVKAGRDVHKEPEEEIPCSQCDRIFLDNKHLKAHIKSVHTPKPKKGKGKAAEAEPLEGEEEDLDETDDTEIA